MPQQLDSPKKKLIFDILKTKTEFREALVKAALNNEDFPLECQEFSDLCKLHARMKLEAAKTHLKSAIHEYIDLKILELFQTLLTETFDAKKWSSGFLLFLANDIKD